MSTEGGGAVQVVLGQILLKFSSIPNRVKSDVLQFRWQTFASVYFRDHLYQAWTVPLLQCLLRFYM